MIPLLRQSVRLCPGTTLVDADDDDEFNSHFEDHQDLAPEDETHNVFEIHSNVSSEDMRFQNFIEEVFSFFFWPTSSQRKQMRFWEGTGWDLPLKWKC